MRARLAGFLAEDDAGKVLLALKAQSITDRSFTGGFRARFWDRQLAREQKPLRRALARGELPAGTDIACCASKLVGPLYAAAEEGLLSIAFARDHARLVPSSLAGSAG